MSVRLLFITLIRLMPINLDRVIAKESAEKKKKKRSGTPYTLVVFFCFHYTTNDF